MPSKSPRPFRGQNYYELKTQLREKAKLFTDPEFPPADISLFYKNRPFAGFEWKRPGVS